MDENTIQIIQALSSKIDMMLWIMNAGFGITFSLMFLMWNHFNKKFEQIDQRFEKVYQRFEKIDQRLERIEDKINALDKRLVAVETMMHMKDGCMIKDDRFKQKAE